MRAFFFQGDYRYLNFPFTFHTPPGTFSTLRTMRIPPSPINAVSVVALVRSCELKTTDLFRKKKLP